MIDASAAVNRELLVASMDIFAINRELFSVIREFFAVSSKSTSESGLMTLIRRETFWRRIALGEIEACK